MKKVYLDIGFDYDFLLFGIVSQERSHSLAWIMNRDLRLNFKRSDDLQLQAGQSEYSFDKYDFFDEMNHLDLYLLGNRDESAVLIPELRNIDYFVVVKGAIEFFRKRKFTSAVKTIPSVQLISEIGHQQLKSKQHLIF